MNENSTIFQVAEYLDLINNTLKQTIPSNEFFVEGEVSDFRVAQEKWVSFDLKDEKEQAVLKCFMTVWQLQVQLEDGMRVQVQGFPKVYERFGTFKMNVQSVEPVGEGALRRAYELLKKKLKAEGLFDTARKRPLKRFPERIGLITSRDAAAHGDFLRILNNRFGGVRVDFTHVHVQGKNAVADILGSFRYFNSLPEGDMPDAIVMTRGGGGLEDLHAFNDEQVARAIFQSKIPVVVGVGHERDESLCDFVADVRASTPSNAAERVVPNRNDVIYEIDTMTRRMEERLGDVISDHGLVIERATNMIGFILDREQDRVKTFLQSLFDRVDGWLPSFRDQIEFSSRILKQIDPKRVLARGYSIVSMNGQVLSDSSSLEVGVEVGVQLARGSFDATVKRVKGKGQQKLV